MACPLFIAPAVGALAPLQWPVSPACIPQGAFPAGDRFRVRENIVGTSGPRAGFTHQQRKGE